MSLRVAVSGASGLVGSSLTARLEATGHRVSRLVRREAVGERGEIAWDPATRRIDAAGLAGVDAVVNLAGENIAARRWSAGQKQRIVNSRVQGTRLIAETLARAGRPGTLLVNASAIGFYGDRADEPLDETSERGSGFLPDCCVAWEEATQPARQAGLRVVRLRIGVVLDARGGALPRMLRPFRLGLGGRIGDGRQYVSWIALEDLVQLIVELLTLPEVDGPINAVAPAPVTNAELTRALGRLLGRPTLLPLPGTVVRLLLGEMGQELLLASTRVLPRRLETLGYAFRHGRLDRALAAIMGLHG